MTITRVQGNARGTWSSGTSFTVTLASTPTNGNSLVLTTALRGITQIWTISSVSQPGATWSKQESQSSGGGGSPGHDTEIWLASNVQGASATITVNLTGLGSLRVGVANVAEYSGLSNDNPLDKTATNSGTGETTDTGTTATTSQASELWVGSIYAVNAQSSPTNGFTLLDGALQDNSASNAYLEKIVAATGTANSGTSQGFNSLWLGAMTTFKASLNVVATDALRVNDFAIHRTTKAIAHIVRIIDASILRKLLLLSAMLRITERAGVGYLRFVTVQEAIRIGESIRKTISKAIFHGFQLIDYLMRVGPIHFLHLLEPISIRESFMRSAHWIRSFTDALSVVDKISGIARLIVGIAVAIKTLGYYIEKKLHPTQREGDTPVL